MKIGKKMLKFNERILLMNLFFSYFYFIVVVTETKRVYNSTTGKSAYHNAANSTPKLKNKKTNK